MTAETPLEREIKRWAVDIRIDPLEREIIEGTDIVDRLITDENALRDLSISQEGLWNGNGRRAYNYYETYVHAVCIDQASEEIEAILTPVYYFDCQENSSSTATTVQVCQIGTNA